jgi:hypothetical protein
MFMNILVGVMAAIAALIMTSRLGSGQYSAGDGWEMAAIAILAGVWGFWVDHRKDKDLTDETSAAGNADTSSKN